jgi:hypothetical protein
LIPLDADEGLTAEILAATEVPEYRHPREMLEALRAAVKATGIRANCLCERRATFDASEARQPRHIARGDDREFRKSVGTVQT